MGNGVCNDEGEWNEHAPCTTRQPGVGKEERIEIRTYSRRRIPRQSRARMLAP
jgi:hypothetical protein